jgi:hypothetical protein
MNVGKFLLLVIFPLLVIAGIGIFYFTSQRTIRNPGAAYTSNNQDDRSEELPEESRMMGNSNIPWQFNGEEWQSQGTVLPCTEPVQFEFPADINLTTAVLYPGQIRGNDYKPHGGFAFTNSKNEDITVTIPMDAYLVKASRYIEQGEMQYFMVFINPCGIMYRLDHLSKLTPKFQELIDKLPPAQIDDSRTTPIEPPRYVVTGEEIATAVGFKNNSNVTFDLGIYDLRNKNEVSKNTEWASEHENDKEYAPYGVCMVNYFASGIFSKLKVLPAHDSASGKTSDYCK